MKIRTFTGADADVLSRSPCISPGTRAISTHKFTINVLSETGLTHLNSASCGQIGQGELLGYRQAVEMTARAKHVRRAIFHPLHHFARLPVPTQL